MPNGRLLENKVAVVSGAGSGIGAASAPRFAAEGAQVLMADIREHKAQQTLADVQHAGGAGSVLAVDVADEASAENMIAAKRATFLCAPTENNLGRSSLRT